MECDNCFNEYMIEKRFGILKVVGQGAFGRIYHVIHPKTGAIFALKERISEKLPKHIEIWDDEIRIMEKIEAKIPELTFPRLVCALNDSSRKMKNKFLIMEWIEGGDLSNFGEKLKKIENFVLDEKEIVRMMLITLNELKKCMISISYTDHCLLII